MRIKELMESHSEYFYFDYGFDEQIKHLILQNMFPNPSLACQGEARRWYHKLQQLGLDVEIHDGFYIANNDYENPEGHTWLEVEGSIFDPTAGQFDDHGEGEYETHEIR